MASANNAKKGANVRMKRKERKNIVLVRLISSLPSTILLSPSPTCRVMQCLGAPPAP